MVSGDDILRPILRFFKRKAVPKRDERQELHVEKVAQTLASELGGQCGPGESSGEYVVTATVDGTPTTITLGSSFTIEVSTDLERKQQLTHATVCVDFDDDAAGTEFSSEPGDPYGSEARRPYREYLSSYLYVEDHSSGDNPEHRALEKRLWERLPEALRGELVAGLEARHASLSVTDGAVGIRSTLLSHLLRRELRTKGTVDRASSVVTGYDMSSFGRAFGFSNVDASLLPGAVAGRVKEEALALLQLAKKMASGVDAHWGTAKEAEQAEAEVEDLLADLPGAKRR